MTIRRPYTHQNPAVSVVIPTLPDHEVIPLEALAEQTTSDFECVVVEDGTLDICEARNAGIEHANASIIANTDDDCYPPPDWLSIIIQSFTDNPDIVLLEGPTDVWRPPPRHYVGANLAYLKTCAQAIGGFDSTFAGYRDDTDFGWRMEKEFGVDSCLYRSDIEIEHIGPMRSDEDEDKDRLLRQRHPKRYLDVFHHQQSRLRRMYFWIVILGYQLNPDLGEFLYQLEVPR